MKFRTIPLFAAVLLAAPAAFAAPKTPAKDVPAKPAQATAAKAPKAKVAAKKPAAPVTVESLLAGSRAASTKGETELALRLAQSAIVANPARPASYVALGDIYARAGEEEFARSYYQAALGIDPADAGALSAMAALDKPRASAIAAQ
jgi:Flp pilus assembly protein TadD